MLTHRNLIANAINTQMVMPLDIDDVYLVMAPLFHAAGSVSVLQNLYVGAKQVVLPAFDPGGMLDVDRARRRHRDARRADDGRGCRGGAAGATA